MAYKISVIIPIYNVEQYIERCVRTLFEQTLQDIEYIFVNDCTPDGSMEVLHDVLDEYPDRKPAVRIINHERNLGVSCSRIDGMKAANGKYIIHCDTDDWLDLDLYEKMYRKAEAEGAEITVCDFVNEYSDGSSARTSCEITGFPRQMLANMHNKSFYCMLWRSLMKRELIEKYDLYTIPHVDLWEDVYVTLRAYYYANKVVKVDDAVYHYFVNNQSLTATSAKPKHYQDMQQTIELLEKFFHNKTDFESKLLLSFWKLLAKSTLLTTSGFAPKRWQKEYKESHTDIFQIHAIPKMTRWLYWITSKTILPIRLIMTIYKIRNR